MNQYQEIVMSNKALKLIIKERIRQTMVEGYTPAHDDEHTEGQLALLAAAYALLSRPKDKQYHYRHALINELGGYGWDIKSKDPIRDLTRAGALILAELERRLRTNNEEGCGPCSACQTETTYTGEHNGDYPVWLCPDHGGK